ncbi:NAD-dependent epimerase/dehydratase family protein [Vibrio fluvialis]|nr:NAD-dependent epimerase/dehydratase family protein [Vibrio fluvialis]
MNILLTGSNGFVGRTINSKFTIYRQVIRRNREYCFKSPFFVDAIDNATDWSGAFDKVDAIIHLAGLAHSNAYSEKDYKSVNVEGTIHLAREAVNSGVKRFVFVSSIGVNGTSTKSDRFTIDAIENPHNLYAQSKYDAELGLKKIAKETGLEVVIVRPTLVYGKNAPGNFGMLTKLVRKMPVLPFGLADNRRNFIAVQNLADLLVTCAIHPDAGGHTFFASDSETVSIKNFTNAIAKGLGKELIQIPIPLSLMRFAGKLTGRPAIMEQLLGNLEVDSSNVKQVLGWSPPFTMEEAMASLRSSEK